MKRYLLFLCLVAISGSLLYAQPFKHRGGPPAGMRQHMKQELMEDLKLTDAQKEQVEKLMLAHRRKMIDTRATLEKKRLDMRELMNASKPDRSAIEKALKAVSDAQYQHKLDRLDHWFAVKEILTPEQQKIWKQHMRPMERGKMGRPHPMRMRLGMNDTDDDEEDD